MCSPMPDLDPDDLNADEPPCERYPDCDSPINNWYQGAQNPCTWPDCTEGHDHVQQAPQV